MDQRDSRIQVLTFGSTPGPDSKAHLVGTDSSLMRAEGRPFLRGERTRHRTDSATGRRANRLHNALTERTGTPYSKICSRLILNPTIRAESNIARFTGRCSQPGTDANIGRKLFHYIFRSRACRYGPNLSSGKKCLPKGGDVRI